MAATLSFYVVLVFAISVRASLGNKIECENLNRDSCTYAVSSMGKRCVLEKGLLSSVYTCRTSGISAGKLRDYIETEECISTCGVDRRALGISSDSLLDRNVAQSICSEECYNNCPNIVDLYFNLAAGEGVYLPKFCEARKSSAVSGRREMIEFNSVGVRANLAPQAAKNFGDSKDDFFGAPAPGTAFGESKESDENYYDAPTPAPQTGEFGDSKDQENFAPVPAPDSDGF